jgi:hypothetical protein
LQRQIKQKSMKNQSALISQKKNIKKVKNKKETHKSLKTAGLQNFHPAGLEIVLIEFSKEIFYTHPINIS